ncbi:MAG: hypothetical protein DI586_05670 [Micavibrio aeruginosavorus]|uniref:N-acetyltransferase domain-containing protein n=1 Tax=Micavibrio aeruginosavorus TaxID=349221 RepID=A0A2W5FLG1_9BACT|nr:MAG: hypothetical protein DI586_05670 [Micavibrio aeruginosavorus]
MSYTTTFEAAASPKYQFQLIGPKGLPDVTMLWNKAKNSLQEGKEHHLKPLSDKNLSLHSESGYPVVGMVDSLRNRLVAVLLLTPGSAAVNEEYKPVSVTEMPGEWQKDTHAIIQCVAADPDYKKQGLAKALLAFSEEYATTIGIRHLFAKVAHDNIPSQGAFWKADYVPVLETSGKYGERQYAASYFSKAVAAQGLALSEIPVFNGCHVNDNSLAQDSRSLSPV